MDAAWMQGTNVPGSILQLTENQKYFSPPKEKKAGENASEGSTFPPCRLPPFGATRLGMLSPLKNTLHSVPPFGRRGGGGGDKKCAKVF